jgi:Holliday junction resolvase
MGRMSRNKGKVGEREVAALLREHGFAGARGVQYQGGRDSADVTGLPGFHIEVKRTEAFSAYKALEQAVADSGGAGTPIVFHRSNSRQWIVVLNADSFLDLMKSVHGIDVRLS